MIARIKNNAVVEWLPKLTLDDVPLHKRSHYRPVVEEKSARSQLEMLAGPDVMVEADRVVKRWGLERRPLADQREQVKDECQRRILAALTVNDVIPCILKQLNALMRSVKLTDTKHARELTASEVAEAAALEGLSIEIERLRAKSNAIEAMDPIPLDYAADKWWA